ncbi:helix-turn-helix transcriptional regulator [Pseudoduganella buxea]
MPAVIDMVGKSRTAIYRDMQLGAFPTPVRVGARALAWHSTEIASWQQRRTDEASPVQPKTGP